MPREKKIKILIGVLILAAVAGGIYWYTQKPKDNHQPLNTIPAVSDKYSVDAIIKKVESDKITVSISFPNPDPNAKSKVITEDRVVNIYRKIEVVKRSIADGKLTYTTLTTAALKPGMNVIVYSTSPPLELKEFYGTKIEIQ